MENNFNWELQNRTKVNNARQGVKATVCTLELFAEIQLYKRFLSFLQ